MFTPAQIMDELKTLGSEQTRKTYLNHGACEFTFGVKYADLSKLVKKVKVNHELATELWQTENHEARLFALMIADPKKIDHATLDEWAKDLSDYVVSGEMSRFVVKSPLAKEKMEAWVQSDDEWISTAGWNLLGAMALEWQDLSNEYLLSYMAIIQKDIHTKKNRTRYAMNGALIAIGGRNTELAEKAIAAANSIGKVIVDHGKTSCKTPDAIPYIQKIRARAKN
jgi:3-methyladenine DNA glycosylase AlkD